ncbi:MAG: NifU family protein [Bdellovibrionales bacterium CG10_big_fil_rev_8_21_14_0_10_45_34]|nr:MAG: NifU family protein [Bdellovibrionales bacterium CG10_big_fil_rev_8_21_14_0_10_45_34]
MNYIFHFEQTPNTRAVKFVANKAFTDQTAQFESSQDAIFSPLASKIFGFPWAEAVYIAPEFVTVTKQDWVSWEVLAEPLCEMISEHLNSGLPALSDKKTSDALSENDSDDSKEVRLIKHILNTEIRPAVAFDGGDIVFQKYEDYVVYVALKGSCSGCQSSVITLKEGVESRLRNALPEIQGVVAV